MENNFVQIIIPAAGKGQRFVDAGFTITSSDRTSKWWFIRAVVP